MILLIALIHLASAVLILSAGLKQVEKKKPTMGGLSVTLENWLVHINRREWARIVNSLAKSFTADERKRWQLVWRCNYLETKKREYALIQAEIHVLETLDQLRQRQENQGLMIEEKLALDALEREQVEILSVYKEVNLAKLTYHRYAPAGAWIREILTKSLSELFEEQVIECKANGGCCARACQCCMKPWQGLQGQMGTLRPGDRWHCMPQCGCCIRWYGFYQRDERNRRNEEWKERLPFSMCRLPLIHRRVADRHHQTGLLA